MEPRRPGLDLITIRDYNSNGFSDHTKSLHFYSINTTLQWLEFINTAR